MILPPNPPILAGYEPLKVPQLWGASALPQGEHAGGDEKGADFVALRCSNWRGFRGQQTVDDFNNSFLIQQRQLSLATRSHTPVATTGETPRESLHLGRPLRTRHSLRNALAQLHRQNQTSAG